jgi:catalase
MSYHVDTAPGQNQHVNYEPSVTGGLKEAEQ